MSPRILMSLARQLAITTGLALCLSACSLMTAAGPSSRAVGRAEQQRVANADIKIVDVTEDVARLVLRSSRLGLFSETFGETFPVGSVVGLGDILDIAIWEAPPAALFGSGGGDTRFTSSSSTARGTTLPEQLVKSDGQITVPFAGAIQAAGRTPEQIERDIALRLAGKAHRPQIIVRVVRNATFNVTVVGDVANSARVPLTARGERLLDVLASVGGVKQPVGKMTIQITRGPRVASLPLEMVIRDPRQNIRLQPDDVVTALFQPFSFTALGATGANAEVPFEGTGISLAQALGRVGGLQDFRADVRGVFLFRLENPVALDPVRLGQAQTTTDGKVPVIYRIDMKNPKTFFVAQSFPIQNGDVLYVSNAPLADLQKFVNIISSMVYPVISIENATSN